ncbi:oxygenase MpaB family protein [Actinacidiphila sp. bgisy145]|uniref:oxygenase MpaB family protein n=1 Tax=Actinacidiphila sp. bgisy145 TaxID=3413792 RepID=UPI003EB79067
MKRHAWLERIETLDPETDFAEIYRISGQHEFPWDTSQSLSFALYRTYAVPAIGNLLAETGEFTRRAQKRYDDTVLILEAALEHGFDAPQGREAIRRMNRMHRRYDIADDDFRYVLATFVVVPRRWVDAYGWRPYCPHEVRATVNYYRELGRRMGLRDIPATYEEFEELLDAYERAHFAFTPGGRAVSDATLDLMRTWYPKVLARQVRLSSICLLDDPLREAFGYPRPPAALQKAVRAGMRLRGRVVRHLPPRRTPSLARNGRRVRSYPDGFRIGELGTFAPGERQHGCPVPRERTGEATGSP